MQVSIMVTVMPSWNDSRFSNVTKKDVKHGDGVGVNSNGLVVVVTLM